MDLSELAGNVRGVTIEDRGVAVFDLSRVVHDDDLGNEGFNLFGRVVLGITANVSSLDVLDRETLDVESNIVSGNSLRDRGVMHFDGLDIRLDISRGESDVHAGIKDTGFDSSDGDSADTTDLVDVLKGKSEGLFSGPFWGFNLVKSFNESGALVPGGVGGSVQHVITVPSGNRDEWDGVRLVADLLQEIGDFFLDFVVPFLREVDSLFVHLVHADDHLFDTKSEGKESVLSGLSFLGDTSLKLSLRGGDHEDGTVGLRGSGDHVLDEISVAGGIDDGEVVFGGLELPEGDIDGDTSFSFRLELVHNPGVFEGGLASFGSFLFEFFDGSLVNSTAFVDEMTSGGGLSGVDVSNDDQVDVSLIFL